MKRRGNSNQNAIVSAFAWYVASSGLTKSSVNNDTLVLASNTYSAGGFTVTPIFSEVQGNPELTGTDGKVHYYAQQDTTFVNELGGGDASVGYATTVISLKIVYDGEMTDTSAIKGEWQTNEYYDKVQVTISGSALGVGRDENEGLKFWLTNAPDSSSGTPSLNWTGAETVSMTFNTSDLSFSKVNDNTDPDNNKYRATVSALASNGSKVFVGVKGVDGVEQESTDQYRITATPNLID